MRWTFWRGAIARSFFGIVLPVATGSAAFGNGLIDPNVRWDASVARCNYPCPQQPCDCLPCDPPGATKAKAPAHAPAESAAPSAKGQTEPEQLDSETIAPSSDQLAYSSPSNYSNVSSGAQNVGADDAGYLDWARIATRLRVRYDDYRGANKPTRAEFFYPTPGPDGAGPQFGGGGGGVGGELNFRALETYLEVAFGPQFSVFVEAPVRWVDDVGAVGNTTDGFGDIKSGVRYALFASGDEWLTLQLRSWSPTGDARQALGVGHSSLDLALLYQNQLNSRTQFWWEVDDWQSLDTVTVQGFDLNSNILQYGFGVGYDLFQSGGYRPSALTGVVEVVGWTVLDGFVTDVTQQNGGLPFTPPQDASGDTIVNGKYGLRYKWAGETVYVGYGHNWTTDRWYSDILRLEYTHYF